MDVMINLDTQTDMYSTYAATCGPQTDIGGYLNKSPEMSSILPDGELGRYSCTKPLGGWGSGVCDQSNVVINTSALTTYAERRKTLCHEVGHAVGLPHDTGYGGCMVSGYSPNTTYSSHHVAHINANF